MNIQTGKTKYYYLAYEPQADGSRELVQITRSRWHEILRENKGKTGHARRYFTREYNAGYDVDYWMICEVSWEDYQEWDADRHLRRRSEKVRVGRYRVISLDAPAYQEDDGEALLYGDIIADPNADTARDGEWLAKVERFRQGIADWRDWGAEMLAYHEADMRRSCTKILAEKSHRCEESIRYRKREFRAEAKNLCKRHGIGDFD